VSNLRGDIDEILGCVRSLMNSVVSADPKNPLQDDISNIYYLVDRLGDMYASVEEE